MAAAAFFKLRSSGFDKEECKECLKSLPEDLEDVAEEVKEKLTIVPVKKVTDVLKAVLES